MKSELLIGLFLGIIISLAILLILFLQDLLNPMLIGLNSFSSVFISSFEKIYLKDLNFLILNIVLSISFHIFILVILVVITEEEQEIEEIKLSDYEETQKNIFYFRFLPLYLVKFTLKIIGYFKYFTSIKGLPKEEKKEENLEVHYIIGSFLWGTMIAIVLLVIAEIIYNFVFLFYGIFSFLIILFLLGLGQVRNLDAKFEDFSEVGYRKGRLMIYSTEKIPRQYLGEKMALLGLSLNAGIVGIITTIWTVTLELPISFALVPATFDMLSVLTAFLELPRLKIIRPLLFKLKRLIYSVVGLFLAILWSIFLSGILWIIYLSPLINPSENLMITVVSGLWILIAVLLSFLVNEKNIKPKNLAIFLLITILPYLIIII